MSLFLLSNNGEYNMTKATDIIDLYVGLELDEAFYRGLQILESYDLTDQCETANQEKTDEAFGVVAILGLVMAMPSFVKLVAKAFGWIYKKIVKLFTKKDIDSPEFIDKIIIFAEKWHDKYIIVLEKILKIAGVFKAAKLEDHEKQKMAAEVLFYIIVFGMAVYSGVGATKAIITAIQNSSAAHSKIAVIESVLTGLKSKEVKTFIQNISA